MNERFQMLCDYLDELWELKGLPPLALEEKLKFYAEIAHNEYTQWIDIREDDEFIGFLVVGVPPNCHPDANFYIAETYIKPVFRRRGHMYSAVSDFVRKHVGVYCLFVLHKNETAQLFWENAFAKLGYIPCELRDVGAGDEFCKQHGYKPKECR